jgi:uncharacterized protein
MQHTQSRLSTILLLVSLLFVAIASGARADDLPIPRLTARVTDQAALLTPDQRIALEEELKRYEDSTSNQFTVLIIPSLQGEDLEDYSQRVAEANGIGTKKNSNGLLLLVAVEEHKIRIQVGYGLEGAITDAMSALIIKNEIKPRFKAGDFFGGLQSGMHALMLAAAGEYKAEPKSGAPEGFGFGGIIVLIIIFFVISRIFGGRGRGGRGGGGSGILPWLIASQVLGSRRGGGWSSGGFGGGGGWGGGSSGGGWSGGGGSFGGGGASGGW